VNPASGSAIPPAPFFSGGRRGVGEGGGLRNRRADVYIVARCRVCSPTRVVGGARVRIRVRSSTVGVGGARSSREGVPLRLVVCSGAGGVKAAALCAIMLQLLTPMVLYSGATGEFGSCCTGVRVWSFVAVQVKLLLLSSFMDVGCAVGSVEDGELDPPRFPLGRGGRCRWRARIWELEELGRGPGRWSIADGFIPSSGMGVYFDSVQSQRVMELFRFMVVRGDFFVCSGQRRCSRALVERIGSGSEDFNVIFCFFRVL
jgi:hypothetical protein